jgi:hypothetical protein
MVVPSAVLRLSGWWSHRLCSGCQDGGPISSAQVARMVVPSAVLWLPGWWSHQQCSGCQDGGPIRSAQVATVYFAFKWHSKLTNASHQRLAAITNHSPLATIPLPFTTHQYVPPTTHHSPLALHHSSLSLTLLPINRSLLPLPLVPLATCTHRLSSCRVGRPPRCALVQVSLHGGRCCGNTVLIASAPSHRECEDRWGRR